jgi:synaptobrevin family protein YKT6
VSEEFAVKYPSTAHANWTKGSPELQMPELKEYIKKYQNPEEADSLMKIQKELDQTKIVMQKTIESVMERGEKIDDLVAKSDGLSAQSKLFYTQVREGPSETCARC